jgi:hypothetical protein
MSNLYPEIRRGCEKLLIVEVNLISPKAMVIPWFVIVTGIWPERVKDAVEVMQVLAPDVFLNKLDSGLYPLFSRVCFHLAAPMCVAL